MKQSSTSEGFPMFSTDEYVYGKEQAVTTKKEIEKILPEKSRNSPKLPLDEKDSFLICYGDSFKGGLKKLNEFCKEFLAECGISYVHILPFFPYSSDDGFSIIDYYAVNKEMGNWSDIEEIGKGFKLAADIVLNHCSKKNVWFEGYLKGEEKYKDFFINIEEPEKTDLSMIVRPRALPLLHEFTNSKDEKLNIWTTFSEDQVDLNFESPSVLIEFIKVLMFYVSKGIRVIRLDAIAYIWKEIGHPSIHHPKCHAIVKIFRTIINEYFPDVLLLTETNVPHEENISYFGNHKDEAQMIYQFSLPPLVLQYLFFVFYNNLLSSYINNNVSKLKDWAKIIETHDSTTYFNFLASHDGVGVTPLKGYVEGKDLEDMLKEIKKRGGRVSEKAVKNGKVPYELNISYRDGICTGDMNNEMKAKKFLSSQAILLSVCGTPAVYIHSLIGSGNYEQGVKDSGIFRRINREKVDLDIIKKEILEKGSIRNLIFYGFQKLFQARRSTKAFYPCAKQKVLELGNDSVFGLVRKYDERNQVLCLINSSPDKKKCILRGMFHDFRKVKELITGSNITLEKVGENNAVVEIKGYEVLWMKSLKRV